MGPPVKRFLEGLTGFICLLGCAIGMMLSILGFMSAVGWLRRSLMGV